MGATNGGEFVNPTTRRAFEFLCRAGETGDWQPLVEMLTEDFEFLFPAGPLRGHHEGAVGKEAFLQWVKKRAASRSVKTVELALHTDEWSVYCVDSRGEDALGQFETHVALFFKARGDQLCAYREYIGDITAWI
jgi:ketosteroid isomerase-like protein